MTCTMQPQPEKASRSTAFIRVWDIVSKRSSGPRSGSQRPSATPNSFSLAVPATTKSFAVFRHPMRSVAAIKGLVPPEGVFEIPAITGSMKYGPNRCSYSVDETRWANVSGSISRSSLIVYMFTRKRKRSRLHCRINQ